MRRHASTVMRTVGQARAYHILIESELRSFSLSPSNVLHFGAGNLVLRQFSHQIRHLLVSVVSRCTKLTYEQDIGRRRRLGSRLTSEQSLNGIARPHTQNPPQRRAQRSAQTPARALTRRACPRAVRSNPQPVKPATGQTRNWSNPRLGRPGARLLEAPWEAGAEAAPADLTQDV